MKAPNPAEIVYFKDCGIASIIILRIGVTVKIKNIIPERMTTARPSYQV